MPLFRRTTVLFDNQLEQLASKVLASAEALVEMIDHPERAAELAHVVSDLEHSADRIVRETAALAGLGNVERTDLMNLLERVDDIVDVAHAASERLWLHQVGPATPEAKALGGVFLECARMVKQLVSTLRTLREPHEVLDACVAINTLEQKADTLYREAMLSLFSGKYDALHIVRWNEVYERLERGVNKCENVAKLVEGLVQAIA